MGRWRLDPGILLPLVIPRSTRNDKAWLALDPGILLPIVTPSGARNDMAEDEGRSWCFSSTNLVGVALR